MKPSSLVLAGCGAAVLLAVVCLRFGKPAPTVAPAALDQDADALASATLQTGAGGNFRPLKMAPAQVTASARVPQQAATMEWRAALEAAARLPEPERLHPLCEIVKSWGETAPQTAASYLLGLPPNPERTAMLQVLAGVWARTNPRQAVECLLAKLEPEEKLVVGGEIAATWAMQDPLDALAWLQGQEAGEEFRATTAQLIYSHWAENDPEAAATHLLQKSPAPQEEMKAVMARWVETDSSAALAWLQKNLTSDEQPPLAATVALTLARHDEKAAESFLVGLKDLADWPRLASEVATAMASTNPELADRLAATLSPGAEREQVLRKIRRLSVNASPGATDASGANSP